MNNNYAERLVEQIRQMLKDKNPKLNEEEIEKIVRSIIGRGNKNKISDKKKNTYQKN